MGWIPRRLILLLAGSLLLLAPLLTVQLATGAGRAHACSCSPPPPPLEAFGYADAVFTGRVVSSGAFGFDFFWSVELEVDTVWKGSVTSTTFVYVWFGPSCGYEWFEPGKDFLVYAHHDVFPHEQDDDTLFVHLCSRTRPLEYADDDLQELGEGKASESGVAGALRPSSDEEQTTDPSEADAGPASTDAFRRLAWWAPLLAGLAAAALIIRRWTRHRELE